jgi:hypothetical protein
MKVCRAAYQFFHLGSVRENAQRARCTSFGPQGPVVAGGWNSAGSWPDSDSCSKVVVMALKLVKVCMSEY